MIFNITRFELLRLFTSPLAWSALAGTQVLLSFFFYELLTAYLVQPAAFDGLGLTETVVAGFYRNSGLIFILLVPFLTMRTLSEEIRQGTFRLLFSSPVSTLELVTGKFLAVLLLLVLLLLVSSLAPASLAIGTRLDFFHLSACLLGVILLLASLTAIGLFMSSLFRYPVYAALATLCSLVLLWTIQNAANTDSGMMSKMADYLSLSQHFIGFTRGILNTADLAYFLIISLAFVALTIWRIDVMRTQHW